MVCVWLCYYSPAALQTLKENMLQALNVAQNRSGQRNKNPAMGRAKQRSQGKGGVRRRQRRQCRVVRLLLP